MFALAVGMRSALCRRCPTPCAAYAAGDREFLGDPCAACPLEMWHPFDCGQAPPEPELPSKMEMARNFLRASASEAAAIAKRTPKISEEEAARRQAICAGNACGQHRPSDDRCAACGCPVRAKSRWRSLSCPRGLW